MTVIRSIRERCHLARSNQGRAFVWIIRQRHNACPVNRSLDSGKGSVIASESSHEPPGNSLSNHDSRFLTIDSSVIRLQFADEMGLYRVTDETAFAELFARWQSGDGQALDQLMPLVYGQLKQIAARLMSSESHKHTLQTTAVVNELYLKLANQSVQIENKAQFFGLCARVIRNLLVDHARGKNRDKRWGHLNQVTFSDEQADVITSGDFLSLDSAIDRLEQIDPVQQQYLVLHYFAGLSYTEVADVSNVSRAQVGRELKMAKAWLALQLSA